MFKYLPLLWAQLGRKKLRTGLTLASIVVAFLLFGLMQTMRVALTGNADLAGADRLMTMHKMAIVQPLPESYVNRIRAVEGVKVATSFDWFGGIYREDRNQVPTFAVDVATFVSVYPEYALPPEQKEAWAKDRTAAVVGKLIAQQNGWKVGDTIPMRSNVWVQKDGSNTWPMKIAGIYDASNGDNLSVYFHREYLDESRGGGVPRGTIGWVVMRIADPAKSGAIARTPSRPAEPSGKSGAPSRTVARARVSAESATAIGSITNRVLRTDRPGESMAQLLPR